MGAAAKPTSQPKFRWLTAAEFGRMADQGYFRDERVELIEGKIIALAPQRDDHAVAVHLVAEALGRAFGEVYREPSGAPSPQEVAGYRSQTIVKTGDEVKPLVAKFAVPVNDLLP